MENFNLKKFLVENNLTTSSKMLKEVEPDDDYLEVEQGDDYLKSKFMELENLLNNIAFSFIGGFDENKVSNSVKSDFIEKIKQNIKNALEDIYAYDY